MLLYMVHIEVRCNGNTQDFGSCIRGSNPLTSTNIKIKQNKMSIAVGHICAREYYCCDNRDIPIFNKELYIII